jgi:RHS repeat-associated protein
MGQPTHATLPGETVTYSYGANGRTESVTDGRGTTTIAYETGNDRVSSVTDPVTGAIGYTYLTTGERSTLVLPGGNTWTYTYDASTWRMLPKDDPNSVSRMLYKITDDQSKEVEHCISNDGRVREVRGNKTVGQPTKYMTARYEFDSGTYAGQTGSHGWLRQLSNTWYNSGSTPTTSTIVQNDYTYDQNGNRLTNQISDNVGVIRTEEYGYDALSRLTTVDYDDGETQTYAFDAMGNRTQKGVNGTNTNYTYNNANMLLTRGGFSYTNDNNGNTLTGGGRTNTWDGQNRLTQCAYSGTTTTFTYGSDGLRRSSTSGGTSTNFVLDGDNVVREAQNGSPVATYLHGPRGPESRRDGSNVYRWYVYDGLGSVLAEVDASGTVTATRKYDVYGAVRGTTGTGTSKHKFVGALGHPSEDGTGLMYMRARYVDPVVGVFISEDPTREGNNWFQYAGANPINCVDRSGKSFQRDILKVIAAVFVVVTGSSFTGVAFAAITDWFALFSKVFSWAVAGGRTAVDGMVASEGGLNFGAIAAYIAYGAVVAATGTMLGAAVATIFAVWTIGWALALVSAMNGVDAIPESVLQ